MKITDNALILPHNLILYAKAKAYEITKEIESIDLFISNIKNEKIFCEKHTRNFQQAFEYHVMIFQFEKQKRKLEFKSNILDCIAHKPININ